MKKNAIIIIVGAVIVAAIIYFLVRKPNQEEASKVSGGTVSSSGSGTSPATAKTTTPASTSYAKAEEKYAGWLAYIKKLNWNPGNPAKDIGDALYQIAEENKKSGYLSPDELNYLNKKYGK